MKLKTKNAARIRRSLLLAAGLFVTTDQSQVPIAAQAQLDLATVSINNSSELPAPVLPELEMETGEGHSLDQDAEADRLLRDLFLKEKYVSALQLAKTQIRDEALSGTYKAWVERQIRTIKLGGAWAYVKDKNCQDALALFDELLKAGAEPLALKGIGYCYLQKRDWWTAASYLDSYLEHRAADPEAYLLLAEAKESLGSYDEALELTQKAKEIASLSRDEGKELEARERGLIARADEGQSQTEVQAGNYIIRYQPADHLGLVEGALELLQSSEQMLTQRFGLNSPEHPIEVIFHRVESFADAAHSPTWASGIYDGRIRIPVPEGQELNETFTRVLRHELTHALLSEQVGRRRIPTWFQEGLAQIAECPNLCLNYSFAATQQPFLNPESFAASFVQLPTSEAQVAYKQSFYLFQILYRIHGLSGIRQIIEAMPQLRNLDADSLLGQNQLTFAELHQKAKDFWKRQISF